MQKTHDFILGPVDTDSISFCKPDESDFTEEEKEALLAELNSLYPERIRWEDDGFYPKIIVLAAKNYALYDGKKIKTKGSGIRDQKKEPALTEMLNRCVEAFVFDKRHLIVPIYEEYIKEAVAVKDISRWATKKTVTEKLESSTRKNETKVIDALVGEEYNQGDKVFIYPAIDGEILTKTPAGKDKMVPNRIYKLIKNWSGDEDKHQLIKKVHSTMKLFKFIFDINLLLRYDLKKEFETLMGIEPKVKKSKK